MDWNNLKEADEHPQREFGDLRIAVGVSLLLHVAIVTAAVIVMQGRDPEPVVSAVVVRINLVPELISSSPQPPLTEPIDQEPPESFADEPAVVPEELTDQEANRDIAVLNEIPEVIDDVPEIQPSQEIELPESPVVVRETNDSDSLTDSTPQPSAIAIRQTIRRIKRTEERAGWLVNCSPKQANSLFIDCMEDSSLDYEVLSLKAGETAIRDDARQSWGCSIAPGQSGDRAKSNGVGKQSARDKP